MKIYTAPENVPYPLNEPSIFLAGSIEMGKAAEWQKEVIEALKDKDVAIYNPRREVWNSEWKQSIETPEFAEQVNWELDLLERADIVFFFFDSGTLSPVSLLELGLTVGNCCGLVVVAEPGFWRRGNIEVLCDREGITLHDNLQAGIDTLVKGLVNFRPAN